MKRIKYILFSLVTIFFSFDGMGATYTWYNTTGTATYDWTTLANWRVGGAVPGTLPGSGDDVVINISGNHTINLPGSSVALNSLQLITSTTGASISFHTTTNPYVFTTTTTVTMTAPVAATGVFGSDQPVNYVVGTSIAITNVRIGYAIQTSSTATAISKAIFGSTYSMTLLSGGGDSYNGGNTFTGNLQITTTSGYASNLIMGNANPDIYSGTVSITKNGTGGIYMSHGSTGNIYNNTITIASPATGGIYWSNAGGTSTFNGTAAINGTMASGNVRISNLTQATGNTSSSTITVSSGTFLLSNVTHRGALSVSSSGCLTITGSTILGVFQPTVGCFAFTSTVFSTTTITLTANANQSSSTGCTYNDNLQITTNSGYTGTLYMGLTSPDTYIGTITLIKDGAGGIYMSHNSAGNTYNNTITLSSSTGSGYFWGYGNGTSIFNGTATINGTLNAGTLFVKNLQKTSTAASTIIVSAGAITFGANINYAGTLAMKGTFINMSGNTDVDAATPSPNVFLNDVTLEYTAATNSIMSDGGNWYKGNLTITNSSSNTVTTNCYIAYSKKDKVDGILRLINNGLNYTLMVRRMLANNDVYISNTSTSVTTLANGIYLGENSIAQANFTLGLHKSIKVIKITSGVETFDNAGFDSGILTFANFTNIGDATSSTCTLNLPKITIWPPSTFNTLIDFQALSFTIVGGTFNKDVIIRAYNGTTNSVFSAGGMTVTFNANLTCYVKDDAGNNPATNLNIANGGTLNVAGNLILEQQLAGSKAITANGGAINVGGNVYLRHAGGNNNILFYGNSAVVMGDIFVSKAAEGAGNVQLGNGASNVLKHYGYNVSIETGKTFIEGSLSFSAYQQMNTNPGGTDIISIQMPHFKSDLTTINVTGVSITSGCIFYSPINITTHVFNIYGNGTVFNNTANFRFYGSGSTARGGTYMKTVTFLNSSPGTVAMFGANTDINTFYGEAIFTAENGMGFALGGNLTSVMNFYTNITYTTTATATFSIAGISNFLGSTDQYFNCSSASTTLQHININKPSGKLYLQKDLIITGNATLTKGIIVVPSGKVATFNNGSAVLAQGLTSYIDGKAQKIGNVAFTYPIGKGTIYAPLAISAPCNAAAAITVEYIHATQPAVYSGTFPSTIADMSNLGYWTLACPNTYSCSVAVTLPWNITTLGPINKSIMTVAKYASSAWYDAGNVSSTGDAITGSVTGAASTAFVGDYTLGYKTAVILHLENVYSSRFKMSGSNIDFMRDNSVSPPVDRIYGETSGAYTYTKLSTYYGSSIVIHPSMNATCAQIDILAPSTDNATYSAMSLCLVTDASGNITNIKTSPAGQNLSTDYYTYNSTDKSLYIYSNKKPDGKISIVSNLSYGTIWRKMSNATLSFTVSGNKFTYAHLKVTDIAGAVKFDSDVTFTSLGSLDWNGSTITTDGLYIYYLSLGSTAGGAGAIVYKGDMLVKTSE